MGGYGYGAAVSATKMDCLGKSLKKVVLNYFMTFECTNIMHSVRNS